MSNKNSNESDAEFNANADDALLVAYLDGELSDAESLGLERRLSSEPDLCERLYSLQKSWDLLDSLPTKTIDHSFTRSTIELVIEEELRNSRRSKQIRFSWAARVAAALLLFAVSVSLSYGYARYQQAAPHRELANKLEFLEISDLYGVIPSIEFLERLNESGVLPETWFRDLEQLQEEVIETAPQSVSQSRQRLEDMNMEQLLDLRSKKDSLEKESKTEQVRRQNLHLQLMQHPQHERLLTVAEEFKRWLSTIEASERIQLLGEEDLDKQFELIAKIRSRQEARYFGLVGATALPAKDVQPFSEWVEQLVKLRAEDYVNRLARNVRQNVERRTSERLRPYTIFLWQTRRLTPRQLIDQQTYQDMLSVLSSDARNILNQQEDEDKRLELALSWIANACRAKTNPPLTDVELFDYLKTLPPERQLEFDDLSPQEWRQRLKEAYYLDYERDLVQ
ncbi:MAG TPA: hypothetical protein PKD64_17750 [Pirellulaceae bacterium]|nr:hypothetical protein [Pirellulaceae bacterium]HMO94033.1 hypothetical protein [Pirellulaceae bacterium]HMP70903.1 hypothetical protein [Pirellulaceae bacterium]